MGVIYVAAALWTIYDIAQGPNGTLYRAVNSATNEVVEFWASPTKYLDSCSKTVTQNVNEVISIAISIVSGTYGKPRVPDCPPGEKVEDGRCVK